MTEIIAPRTLPPCPKIDRCPTLKEEARIAEITGFIEDGFHVYCTRDKMDIVPEDIYNHGCYVDARYGDGTEYDCPCRYLMVEGEW